ncbi:MAG: S8 family peptidase [Aestuariivirga sp.]
MDELQSPRVIVRFQDQISVKDRKDAAKSLMESEPGLWRKLVSEFGDVRLTPAITSMKPDEIRKLQSIAAERDPTYAPANFDNFFEAEGEKVEDISAFAAALRRMPSLRSVEVERGGPPPLVDASNDPLAVNQGYLDAAPGGINARFAWTVTGGDGAGQAVVDVEGGWELAHEDLTAHGATLIGGTNSTNLLWRSHGTSVLGEICASDNTVGCVGIAPNVGSVRVSSIFGSSYSGAILAALPSMSFGDVLLIELQTTASTTPAGDPTYGPIEVLDINYEAIRLATALGIVVVEAGGNGTNNGGTPAVDLDVYTNAGGQRILWRDPTNADFRDSGAIIVAAATSSAPHTRLAYSTFGERIDCYGWGQNVETTTTDAMGSTTAYRSNFGGTSSASPIVTGAALCLQGVVEQANGFRMSPRQVRAILSDPALNTLPSAAETTAMGVLPNLQAIINTSIGATPDIYLRDFVGDSGEPHGGAISASPDIIARPVAVANPQASFGAGSGTENSASEGYTVQGGQDNFIYVRALNQGPVDATGATATVYWSEVSTLVTPDLWNLVGTVNMPAIPQGEVLTCADALTWSSGDIPATGHYCFVGLLDHPNDPAPGPADFGDWTNFTNFIRNNNNVTWRNFNVEDPAPAPGAEPEGFVALPFLVPGAFDEPRDFAIEMIGKLPRDAKVMLELPVNFLEIMKSDLKIEKVDRGKNIAVALLPPSGKILLGRGRMPAKARFRMRLLVALAKEDMKRPHQIAVRQLYLGEEEVGRVTWRLEPGRRKLEKQGKQNA